MKENFCLSLTYLNQFFHNENCTSTPSVGYGIELEEVKGEGICDEGTQTVETKKANISKLSVRNLAENLRCQRI